MLNVLLTALLPWGIWEEGEGFSRLLQRLQYKVVKIHKYSTLRQWGGNPPVAIEKFMGLLRCQSTVFIVFIFPMHYKKKY